MEGRLNANGRSRSFSADLEGQIQELAPLPPLLAALAGREMEYRGHVELTNTEYLKFSDFRVCSSSAELSGEIFANLSTKKTIGRGFLRIPRLSVLNEPAGRAISGSLALDMQIGGTWRNPTLNIQATGHRVGMEDIILEQAVMFLQAEDLRKAPRGHLALDLQQPECPLKVEGEFLLDSPRLLLSDLSISVAGINATGSLTTDLQALTAEGSLHGESHDLTCFSTLWGETIEGSVMFEASLLSRDKKQDLELDLQGFGLESRFGGAKEFALGLRLKDLFGASEGNAAMKIESFNKGELDLQTLTFLVEGKMKSASFAGSAVGHFRKGFAFQTQGDIDLLQSDARIQVDQFQGQFAGYHVELIPSVVIHRKAHEFMLESAVFLLDKGRLAASGRLGADDITFHARLEGLPVEILNAMVPAEFIGSVNGHLQIAGRLNRPQAFIELRIDNVRLKDDAFQGSSPTSFSINIKVENDWLLADFSLEGFADEPFKGNIQVPATISLSPLSFSVKSKEEVQGQVLAEVDLSLIPAFFYLQDHRLGGRLSMDLVLGGLSEAPEAAGVIRLLDGSYENVRTGTFLRDVQVLARCKDNRIILEEAHGTDGESGTVSARGWLQLFSIEGFPFQWDFVINSATLVRRDDLTILTSGDLRLSSTSNKTLLSGALTVGPAEIRISERLPQEVADLEVVEINRTGQRGPETPPGKASPNGLGLDLRLDAPGRVFMRGRGLDSEWKGELHLTGSTVDPSLTGVLSVIRGRYNFLGKPFSLNSGTLTFGGFSTPSPTLDFSAEYERSDMTAHIRLSGDLTSIDVLMDSEPPLPTDEILSRLLFDRGVASISPIQALQLGQALNAMAGSRSPFDVADRTRRILHVDQLDIKESGEKGGGASVSIGKYLTDNVYVEIEKGVGTEGGSILSEVELTPNLTFESETGTDAHVGVGLNWKWDY
jgi:translocation and assembly module TamB